MNEYQQSIVERAEFERDKNSANDSIQSTLDALCKSVSHDAIYSLLVASNVDVDFINRNERVNAKYNVYAAEKVANVAHALAKTRALNHYTLAILRTCDALERSELVLTHKDAALACSASIKHNDSKREKILAKARYAKHTAANTAATQSSSSINALQTFNVLRESRDAANVVTYSLNRDNAATQSLLAMIAQ